MSDPARSRSEPVLAALKPLWKHREAANGLLYPFLLMFTVLVLISPYMVFNRMAAWADHTPLSAETVAQRTR